MEFLFHSFPGYPAPSPAHSRALLPGWDTHVPTERLGWRPLNLGEVLSRHLLCAFAGQALWPAEADSSKQDPRQIPAAPGGAAPPACATPPADSGPVPAGPAAHRQPRGAEPHTGAGGGVPQAGGRRGEAAERPGEESQENRELGRSEL